MGQNAPICNSMFLHTHLRSFTIETDDKQLYFHKNILLRIRSASLGEWSTYHVPNDSHHFSVLIWPSPFLGPQVLENKPIMKPNTCKYAIHKFT